MGRRFDLLVSPRESTALPVGDPRRHDRYRRLVAVARVNVPRRVPEAHRLAFAARCRDDLLPRIHFS